MLALSHGLLNPHSAEVRVVRAPSLSDSLAASGFVLPAASAVDTLNQGPKRSVVRLPVIWELADPSQCSDCAELAIFAFANSMSFDDSLAAFLPSAPISVVPFVNGEALGKFILELAGSMPKGAPACHLEEVNPGKVFSLPICDERGRATYAIFVHSSTFKSNAELLRHLSEQIELIRLWESGLSFKDGETALQAARHYSQISLDLIYQKMAQAYKEDPGLKTLVEALEELRGLPHK